MAAKKKKKTDLLIKRLPSQDELIDAALEVQPKIGRSALLGGLAMQFYGSSRLTADVDFAALSAHGVEGKSLTIGGVRFQASNGVEVDVIVREDDWSMLYIAATSQAVPLEIGRGTSIRAVTREYLVNLKIASGRPKDVEDAKFLLVQPEFNMDQAVSIAYGHLGKYGVQELRQLHEIAKWEEEKRNKETT